MNYHESGVMPYSWQPKNTETLWSGMDNPEWLEKNPNKEFWKNIHISYKYNAQGFRTYPLEDHLDKKVDIALGCSFTEGVAMPIEHVWTSLIEQQTNIPLLNMGVGSGTTDTVARILTNIAPLFNINTVYILWPKIERFEIYYDSYIETILPMIANDRHIWAMDKVQAKNRFMKNQQITHLLAEKYNFSINERGIDEFFYNQVDTGRDNTHFGYQTNINVAKSFLTS
jgi:hypothetical protein